MYLFNFSFQICILQIPKLNPTRIPKFSLIFLFFFFPFSSFIFLPFFPDFRILHERTLFFSFFFHFPPFISIILIKFIFKPYYFKFLKILPSLSLLMSAAPYMPFLIFLHKFREITQNGPNFPFS